VPTQALLFMNSPFVVDQARAWSQRLLQAPATDDAARVDLAYRMAFARPATPAERDRAIAYLAQSAGKDRANGWASLCQALLATVEFRYLD
jgi:hypothetical protein